MDEAKGRFVPKKPIEGAAWAIEIRGYTDHKDGIAFLKKSLLANAQNFDKFAGDGNKVGKFIVGVQDPVKGKVSHAFIYKVWMVDNAQPNSFVWINGSYLDRLIGGGPAAGGGATGELTPAGGPPGRGGGSGPGEPGMTGDANMGATPAVALGPFWTGLGSAAAGGGPGGLSPGGGREMMPGPGTVLPGPMPGTITPGTVTGKDGKDERRRWEFVVMLIWREPKTESIPPNPDVPMTTTTPGSGS
jgi:hypothetical protein